jgi:hypothetical protein
MTLALLVLAYVLTVAYVAWEAWQAPIVEDNTGMATDVNVTLVAKGREAYVWVWFPSQIEAVLNSAVVMAANPRLSLTPRDVALLADRLIGSEADARCRGAG